MGYLKAFIWAMSIFAAAPIAAQAADFDGSKPLLCSVISITECTSEGGCQKTTIENAGIPQFLKVDVSNKTVSPAPSVEGRKPTPIERMERVEGKLILQGAEDGVENVRDGLGGTAAISEESGKFILSASGEEVAFVIFGACIAQ
jgi:hypothetical protein